MRYFRLAAALVPAVVTGAAAQTPVRPEAGLHACAAIDAAAERLACYDRLAGRAEAAPVAVTAAPAVAAPPASPPAAAPGSAASPPKESFGLYSAEHPTAPPAAQSLTEVVTAMGTSAGGRPTVTLKDGQVWEFDTSDPLLAIGDTVTIRRAALGSFILETPSRRRHRARRLH